MNSNLSVFPLPVSDWDDSLAEVAADMNGNPLNVHKLTDQICELERDVAAARAKEVSAVEEIAHTASQLVIAERTSAAALEQLGDRLSAAEARTRSVTREKDQVIGERDARIVGQAADIERLTAALRAAEAANAALGAKADLGDLIGHLQGVTNDFKLEESQASSRGQVSGAAQLLARAAAAQHRGSDSAQ